MGIINCHSFKIEGFYYDEKGKEFREAHFEPLPKNLVYRMNL